MQVLLRYRLEKIGDAGFERHYFEKRADIPEAALEVNGSFRLNEKHGGVIKNIHWADEINLTVVEIFLYALEADYQDMVRHFHAAGWTEVKGNAGAG